MLTIKLLEKIIEAPLNVKRYSTKFTRIKYFGAKTDDFYIPSYPMSSEMLEEFSDIFKNSESSFLYITAKNPHEVQPERHGSWAEYFKALSDGVAPVTLTKAILKAVIEFINRHSGSCYHEFMILHQLRKTLKFSGSADYENEISLREQAALTKVIEIQALLEDTLHPSGTCSERIYQALRHVANPLANLEAQKLALLELEAYHISQASLAPNGQFDPKEHDKKNFRFIWELSRIKNLPKISTFFLLKEMASLNLDDKRIQSLILEESKISQPKTLGPHWSRFFENLSKRTNTDSLLTSMANTIKAFPKFSPNWDEIAAEFDNLKEEPAAIVLPLNEDENLAPQLQQGLLNNEDIDNDNRETVAFVLSDLIGQLEIQSVKKEVHLSFASRVVTPSKKRPSRKPWHILTPLKENEGRYNPDYSRIGNMEKTPLPQAAEDDIDRLTNVVPTKAISENLPLAEEEVGDAHLISTNTLLQEWREPDFSSQASPLFSEKVNSPGGDDDSQSVMSEMTGISQQSYGYEAPYLVENSDFAREFINNIQACHEENSSNAVKELIERILNWYNEAKQKGMLAYPPEDKRPHAVFSLMGLRENKKLTLQDVYAHIYDILHATVFATRAKKSVSAMLRPYSQDAGAILMQLRRLVTNSQLPVHVQMLKAHYTAFHAGSALEILMHADQSQSRVLLQKEKEALDNPAKNMDAMAEKALTNLPFFWTKWYEKENLETQVEVLNKRRWLEEICANELMKIYHKPAGNLTITEQALVVRAVGDYADKKKNSPFYPALQFLVLTMDDQSEVKLLGQEATIETGIELCQTLIKKADPLLRADKNSTRQERVLNKRMWASLEKLSPQTNNFDWETQSQVSLRSRVSTSTFGSGKSFKSYSSTRSLHRPNPIEISAIQQAGFENVWASYCARKISNIQDVEYVLQNFEAVIQKTDMDKNAAIELLYQVFDYLSAMPPVLGMFSLKRREEIAPEDWEKYMTAYIAPKKNSSPPLLFAWYCVYQAQKKSNVMKTYEVNFIMQNIRYVYMHKADLCQYAVKDEAASLGVYLTDSAHSAISLIYSAWNRKLLDLERKAEDRSLAEEDVAPHRGWMRHDVTEKRIVFSGGLNNAYAELSRRVSALRDKAEAITAAKKSGPTGPKGK